ncbi:hypothetical protein CDG81_13265 [Actinopolyspora erythraea]|uniref:Uncharacterized protein n=1 Tax=Actinopolyspora erythraea TaxID=414996 RepID=A0A223RTD7_9ACTN|nr:hypothetical protein CDG81_13265 [Actinopolyspora erythraea]
MDEATTASRCSCVCWKAFWERRATAVRLPDRSSENSSRGVAADSTTSSPGRASQRTAGRAPAVSSVYSSSVTWKFEPPKPKLDTEARLGCSVVLIHGRARVLR